MDKDTVICKCSYACVHICLFIYIYIHTLESYSEVKNEFMPCARKWVELELTMATEIDQETLFLKG